MLRIGGLHGKNRQGKVMEYQVMSENEGQVLSHAMELWRQQEVFAFIKSKVVI